MDITVSFRGRSGKAWNFRRVPSESPWARSAGAVIFAAPDAYGWRIIRVMELTGRPHDLQPIWALSEAERYGASARVAWSLVGESFTITPAAMTGAAAFPDELRSLMDDLGG